MEFITPQVLWLDCSWISWK